MRKNYPVTEHEYHMQDGKPIVSKTDLKGKITYINPYFVEVSGFDEAELIGSPHNLIRHPDMPAQAFEDMWNTLKSGLPWSAMVKNRRKNGDFYWVVANATPLMENGEPVGYLSVRTKPNRAQVEEAESLYRAMREGSAKVVIHRGQLKRIGWRGWLHKLQHLTLARTVTLLESGAMLLFAAIGAASLALEQDGASRIFASLAALGILWTMIGSRVLRQAVVQPLDSASLAARALAGGDLTVEVDGSRRGQMGMLLRALRQTSVNLRAVIGDVGANVETMNIATGEIAAGNMDLSSRTEAQASNLEETAASMEEIASTVKQNAENAQEARKLVASSTELAVKGSAVVTQVGGTMSDIATSAGKIKDIIGIIDGIAFQTNILALNAAVEAARAGEHGRGFAVVAGEVRSLAQRAALAAKEIKFLIDESVAKVDGGTGLVREAATSMQAILESVRRVESFVDDIAVASAEQSSGIEQVNQAVMQMEDVTQQNAAMVEEAAAAAERLDEQATQVSLAMSLFRTHEGMGRVLRVVPEKTLADIPDSEAGATLRLEARINRRLALPG